MFLIFAEIDFTVRSKITDIIFPIGTMFILGTINWDSEHRL